MSREKGGRKARRGGEGREGLKMKDKKTRKQEKKKKDPVPPESVSKQSTTNNKRSAMKSFLMGARAAVGGCASGVVEEHQ